MEYLFVYGTLLSDIPSSMSKFLRRRADLIGKATTAGTLYDLGGYPGFVAGGSGDVHGELYRLHADRAEESRQLLDAYEGVSGAAGEEYAKQPVEVTVKDGGRFTATTYVYTLPTDELPVIPRGNYPLFYRSNPEHQKFTGRT